MLDETTISHAGPALFGGVLALVGAAGIPVAFQLGRRLAPAGEVSPPRWGFLHVTGVFLASLTASFALALLRSLLLDGEPGHFEALLQMLFVFLVAAGLIVVYATIPGPGGIAALGLRSSGNTRAVSMGAAVYGILLPFLFGVSFAWPWLLERLGGEAESQAVLVGFFELDGLQLAAALVLGTVVMPFFEELIFRGFVQPVVVRKLGPVGGVILTSALFAILHGPSFFLPVFALSLILGAVMLRTQRLIAAWLVHGLHNGLMLLLVLSIPGARELVESVDLLRLFFS